MELEKSSDVILGDSLEEINKLLQSQFYKMCETGKLFVSSVNGKEVWDIYLNSFKENDDPVFRSPESSYNNCNTCYNFIKRYGNIVAIDSNQNIMTIFDIDVDNEYDLPFKNISEKLKNSEIKDVFFETYNSLNSLPYEKNITITQSSYKLGIDKNVKRYTKEESELYGVVKPNEIREFHHFSLKLPVDYVDTSGRSIEELKGFYRDKFSVFKRAILEIPLDTLNLVKDLINQGSLLDGNAHLDSIEQFIKYKSEWESLNNKDIDLYCWLVTYNMNERVAKFKNTLIGVLCSEIAEGEDLNKACENWNKRVDPANYHKAKAPITQKQIDEAKKFVQENGYEEAFDRRFANMDDIKVSEILHSNVGDGELKSISIFDSVSPNKKPSKKPDNFDKLKKVSIDEFMRNYLPKCDSVELLLENKHENNLVTLTTSNREISNPIFKWDNNYSWTYNGNLAGKSLIKDAVKSRGGGDGVVNVRLHFPDTTNDYDLHLFEPNQHHISYQNVRKLSPHGGILDLDAQGVDGSQPPEKRVENITYKSKDKMINGSYDIHVVDYTGDGFPKNFTIEIEIEGDITTLEYETKHNTNKVKIGKINNDEGSLSFKPSNDIKIISSKSISKNVWNLDTNEFHKVKLVCLSPNHWGDNEVGNKHYFFMLDKCKPEQKLRSFHNENLKNDLLQHKKVLEVLGNTSLLEPKEDQDHLAGLGFNSTIKDEVIVKCKGSIDKMLKVTV